MMTRSRAWWAWLCQSLKLTLPRNTCTRRACMLLTPPTSCEPVTLAGRQLTFCRKSRYPSAALFVTIVRWYLCVCVSVTLTSCRGGLGSRTGQGFVYRAGLSVLIQMGYLPSLYSSYPHLRLCLHDNNACMASKTTFNVLLFTHQ